MCKIIRNIVKFQFAKQSLWIADPNKPGPSQQQRPGNQLVPAKQTRVTTMPKPCGIDPIVLLQERENRVAARIAARIEQVGLVVWLLNS